MEYKKVTSCRVCGSSKLNKYIDLGNIPLANGLLSSPDQEFEKYPLQVLFCQDCYLSQLSIVVDPKVLYKNYPYRSSISTTFKRHCYLMAKRLKQMHLDKWKDWEEFLVPQPRLIDIGANDGCLMHQFKRHGFKPILGVEPDRTLWDSIDKDIVMLDHYWCESSRMKDTRLLHMKAHVVTATNVFAHVDNLDDFLQAVVNVLDDSGTFVVEVPYAYSMLSNNEFDTIYHEHLSYFLLHPMKILFEKNGLKIFDVEQYPIHGGTIRVYACKDNRPVNESVKDLLDFERANGMYNLDTYLSFAMRIQELKNQLLRALHGKKFIGFGASAKGSTLLNYFNIRPEYIIDETPQKQGKWIPGINVPVVSYDWHKMQSVENILLVAWNFKDEIITKINASGYKGKWIVPIPTVKVI